MRVNKGIGDLRKNEAVAVDKARILWIKCHELVEQDVSHRGHAHRGTRMAGICFERRINLGYSLASAIESLDTHERSVTAALVAQASDTNKKHSRRAIGWC